MSFVLEQPPVNTPVIEKSGILHPRWLDWLLLVLLTRLQLIAFVAKSFTLTNQHAAIGATALIPITEASAYRVSWRLKITTADGVNSSVQFVLTSIEGGNTIAQPGAALTGDTLQTAQSGSFVVNCDGGSLLSYVTNYASNTANKMGYGLRVWAEQLP